MSCLLLAGVLLQLRVSEQGWGERRGGLALVCSVQGWD